MILSFLASDSVGMIYMRSNLDDNLTWVLGVHIWHSEGAINEKYWFGLHRGCETSTWPKFKCTPQNYPACKISGHFIHWGPFYGTPQSENLDFAPPLFHQINHHIQMNHPLLMISLHSLTLQLTPGQSEDINQVNGSDQGNAKNPQIQQKILVVVLLNQLWSLL